MSEPRKRFGLGTIRDALKRSMGISPTAPLQPEPTLNDLYQRAIDKQILSQKKGLTDRFMQRSLPDEASWALFASDEEFITAMRQGFDETARQSALRRMSPELAAQYSGMHYGETVAKRADAFLDMMQNMSKKHDALLLRKNDSLILFMHGTPSGNVAFHGRSYPVSVVMNRMQQAKLIPDDIRTIFTMSCYGGKQESLVAPGGRRVVSAHTSTDPIIGAAFGTFGNENTPLFGVSLMSGDMTDDFKRFAMEEGTLEVLYSSQEINDAIEATLRPKPKPVEASPETTATSTKAEEAVQVDTAKTSPVSLESQPEFYSDEFYRQHGLDPVQQRQKLRELYESKKARLPEGLRKYFPDAPDFAEETEKAAGNVVVEESKKVVVPDEPVPVVKDTPTPRRVKTETSSVKAATVDKVADTAKASKTLSSKKLGNGGKMAIAAVVAGLVIGKLADDDKPKQSSMRAMGHSAPRMTNSTYNDIQANSYDAQIASNISSYGYGKRVGGFM